METFDVIVIGAGTSGMMAAIAAAEQGAKTILLEKNSRVGKKLLLTGGGRCNVTNQCTRSEMIAHIPGNGKFLYSAFSQFSNQEIIQFFEANHVTLKEEDHGRMFPTTNRAMTIVDALLTQLKQQKVTLKTNQPVKALCFDANNKLCGVQTQHTTIKAPSVIVATGGKTYPSTGSTGDGYTLATQAGHHIQPLYPIESPIVLNDAFIQQKTLQGLALQAVALTVLDAKGKKVVTHQMDLLFTHFGLSGPAALRCSGFVNQLRAKQPQTPVTLSLDLFPDDDRETLSKKIKHLLNQAPEKTVKNALKTLLPERLLSFLLADQQLTQQVSKHLQEKQLQALLRALKAWALHAVRTFPLEKSFVTGGGVALKDISPKTMASQCTPGLFFAGEVLDVHGYTGGYNLTIAFSTGHVAGQAAASYALAE